MNPRNRHWILCENLIITFLEYTESWMVINLDEEEFTSVADILEYQVYEIDNKLYMKQNQDPPPKQNNNNN